MTLAVQGTLLLKGQLRTRVWKWESPLWRHTIKTFDYFFWIIQNHEEIRDVFVEAKQPETHTSLWIFHNRKEKGKYGQRESDRAETALPPVERHTHTRTHTDTHTHTQWHSVVTGVACTHIGKKSRQYLNTKPLKRFEATKGFSLVNCRHGTSLNEEVSLCRCAQRTHTHAHAHFSFFLLSPKGHVVCWGWVRGISPHLLLYWCLFQEKEEKHLWRWFIWLWGRHLPDSGRLLQPETLTLGFSSSCFTVLRGKVKFIKRKGQRRESQCLRGLAFAKEPLRFQQAFQLSAFKWDIVWREIIIRKWPHSK